MNITIEELFQLVGELQAKLWLLEREILRLRAELGRRGPDEEQQ